MTALRTKAKSSTLTFSTARPIQRGSPTRTVRHRKPGARGAPRSAGVRPPCSSALSAPSERRMASAELDALLPVSVALSERSAAMRSVRLRLRRPRDASADRSELGREPQHLHVEAIFEAFQPRGEALQRLGGGAGPAGPRRGSPHAGAAVDQHRHPVLHPHLRQVPQPRLEHEEERHRPGEEARAAAAPGAAGRGLAGSPTTASTTPSEDQHAPAPPRAQRGRRRGSPGARRLWRLRSSPLLEDERRWTASSL